MKNLFLMLVCALTLTTSAAFAQDNNLREMAETAKETATKEANTPDETAKVAETVTEAVAPEAGLIVENGDKGMPKLDENSDAGDVVAVVQAIIDAGKNGQWSLLVGGILMLLIFLMTQFKFMGATAMSKLPKSAIPWVAAGVGILGSVAAELIAGELVWYLAVPNGIMIGAGAVGLWELIGKHIKNKAVGDTPEVTAES